MMGRSKKIPTAERIRELLAEGFTMANIAFIYRCKPNALYVELRMNPRKKLITLRCMQPDTTFKDDGKPVLSKEEAEAVEHRDTGVWNGRTRYSFMGGRDRTPNLVGNRFLTFECSIRRDHADD